MQKHIHNLSHTDVASTMCKIRSKYWIVKLGKMIGSIRNKCMLCKKRSMEMQGQVMGPLRKEKLKPSPVWSNMNLDLFGPFEIRGEVNKLSREKAYGVIFADMASGAIYVDLSQDYSTQGFLLVLRRSDRGTQLVAASKELKEMVRELDISQLRDFGLMDGLEWHFAPADSPWYNGTAESLIRSGQTVSYKFYRKTIADGLI